MENLTRDELIQRLQDLDEEAYLVFEDRVERLHLILVGGSAMVLLRVISRTTHDMDAIGVSRVLSDMLWKYNINTNVNAYADSFPYNFEDRLVPITEVNGKIIDFYTASLEDIVISKLYASRPKDIVDITSSDVLKRIDWNRLESLATSDDELKLSIMSNRRYNDFIATYEKYVEENKPRYEKTDI